MSASKLVLGTVQFGLDYGVNNSQGKPSEEKAFEILNYANANGIKEIDTADAYGNASEVLKRYFHQHPDSFTVMSKFTHDHQKTFTQFFQSSLERLGLNKLEGYYFHRFSDFQNFKEFDQVHKFKKNGQLRKLAVSLYTDDELEIAIHHPEVDVIQLPFNLLDRSEQKLSLLLKAKTLKKEIYVRSVFLQGLFFMEPTKLPDRLRPLRGTLEEINQLAKEYHLSVEELCLNYVLHKKNIDKIVVGVDSIEQLEKNLTSIRQKFPMELEARIEKIQIADHTLLNPATWSIS